MALRLLLAAVAVLLALPAPPASAQGWLQSIFGFGSPPSRPLPPYRSPYTPYPGPFSPYPPRAYDDGQPGQRGVGYRTLCVRMCDGFYFPISHSAPRSALGTDADKCTASCGSDARLFYHPTTGGDVDSMVDLTGRSYADLPNAFKYRKKLVSGCACRPQPWSEAELARHRAYAASEAVAAAPGIAAPNLAARDEAPSSPEFRVASRELPRSPGGTEFAEPEPIDQDALVRSEAISAAAPGDVMLDRPQRAAPARPMRKAQVQPPILGGWGSGGGVTKSPYVWPGDRR